MSNRSSKVFGNKEKQPEKFVDWDHICPGVGCRWPGCDHNPQNNVGEAEKKKHGKGNV